MGSEWRDVTLGEVTDWASGGTPSKANPRFWDGDIPWISASSMKSAFAADSSLHITEEGLADGSRLADRDSVLILVRGSELHKRIPVCLALRPVAFNQDVKALQAHSGMLPQYLFHWLRANEPLLLSKVEHTGIGAGKLDTDVLKSLRISLPPLSEQRAIAGIIGALDDKIELNRRTNETLESIARAIFNSWFVDFDPVRENMARKAGRSRQRPLPGLAAALEAAGAAAPEGVLDLFPDEFEDSELGPIPRGWRVARLDETATFLNGLALQKYPAAGGESLPAIKIAQLRKGNTEGADRVSAELPADYIIDDGDVLFSWSGSLECTLWTGGRGALNQHLFRVTSERYPKWFHYFWIHHHLAEFRRIAAGKATTMGHIQRRHLSEAKVLIPPSPELTAMSRAMSPFIDRLIGANLQSGALAGIRDTLLPKLISGELRLPDAERITRRHA